MRNALSGLRQGVCRCFVGLLVFAQVAFAADVCVADRLTTGNGLLASASAMADLLGDRDAHCANNLSPAFKAPSFELRRDVPDAASDTVLTRIWTVSPVDHTALMHYPPARSGPSLALRYQKLRL